MHFMLITNVGLLLFSVYLWGSDIKQYVYNGKEHYIWIRGLFCLFEWCDGMLI